MAGICSSAVIVPTTHAVGLLASHLSVFDRREICVVSDLSVFGSLCV